MPLPEELCLNSREEETQQEAPQLGTKVHDGIGVTENLSPTAR